MRNWFCMDGNINVKGYPSYFFDNVLRVDFSTAIRSKNVKEQNFSVVPRHWFIDAWFLCERCKEEFCWTAEEQKYWFEELKFNVSSCPHCCKECRQVIRLQKQLRQQYDMGIIAALHRSASPKVKKEMLNIIDHMKNFPYGRDSGEIPESIRRNRRTLEKQLLKQND